MSKLYRRLRCLFGIHNFVGSYKERYCNRAGCTIKKVKTKDGWEFYSVKNTSRPRVG